MPNPARVAVLLSVPFFVLACSAERNQEGEIISGGAVDAFAMQVGDCFDDQSRDGGEVREVPGAPCSEPHDNEVFALFDVSMSEFPGDEEISALADDGCLERFESYVGRSYEESVLAITHLVPTAESWANADDREIVCVAYHMEFDKLEGSVRGTGM